MPHTHAETNKVSCESEAARSCLIPPLEDSAVGAINRLPGCSAVTKWISSEWKWGFEVGASLMQTFSNLEQYLLVSPSRRELSLKLSSTNLLCKVWTFFFITTIGSQGTWVTAPALGEIKYSLRVEIVVWSERLCWWGLKDRPFLRCYITWGLACLCFETFPSASI